jgi:hypothetical protein
MTVVGAFSFRCSTEGVQGIISPDTDECRPLSVVKDCGAQMVCEFETSGTNLICKLQLNENDLCIKSDERTVCQKNAVCRTDFRDNSIRCLPFVDLCAMGMDERDCPSGQKCVKIQDNFECRKELGEKEVCDFKMPDMCKKGFQCRKDKIDNNYKCLPDLGYAQCFIGQDLRDCGEGMTCDLNLVTGMPSCFTAQAPGDVCTIDDSEKRCPKSTVCEFVISQNENHCVYNYDFAPCIPNWMCSSYFVCKNVAGYGDVCAKPECRTDIDCNYSETCKICDSNKCDFHTVCLGQSEKMCGITEK